MGDMAKTDRSHNSSQVSLEEATAAIVAARQERETQALTEINAVLKKHNCRLESEVLLRAGQVIPSMRVIAND